MHIKSWGTKKAEHMMIHYERINYPLSYFSFPLWFLPDLLWTVLTGHRHAETGGESESLWSSALWSGNMIRLPSGSLFWGCFLRNLRTFSEESILSILTNFSFFFFSHQMAFVDTLSTHMPTGEIKMVKLWYLLSSTIFFSLTEIQR